MGDTAISSVWTFLSFFTHEETEMHANTTLIINCLKTHGQLLDHEISEETGIPLPMVRNSLSDLSERGEISHCSVTRFKSGKPIKGSLCRITGYSPSWSTSRKAVAKNSN
jgi:transcription initiation factor IIE alpha subunit